MVNPVTRSHNGLMSNIERQAIGHADKQAKEMARMPHVRIDWQDEHTVPKVWVDGKRVDQLPLTGLVELHLNFSTRRGERNSVNCLDVDWLEHAHHGFNEGHLKENNYE